MDVTDSVAADRQRVLGFADVVRIPARRWRIVVATTALLTAGVGLFLLLIAPAYTATTVVVLRPVVTDPFTSPPGGADRAINMTAENGVALGNEVIDATAHTLGRDRDDVRDALTVEMPTGGAVLRFEYADRTENAAVTGANTAAETYLHVRQAIYQQQREALLRSYDTTTKQITEQRKAAQKELPEGGDAGSASPRVQAVLNQVAALNEQIATLANQRAKIASADLTPGSVTAAARAPVPSSHDAWPLYLAGALFGGVMLGAVATHAQEALDRRVRSADQAADLVGVPALGVVRSAGKNSDEHAAADARYVSLALLKWIERNPDQPIVVLSGSDDEDRSTVSGNLAVALAEFGHDVWLAASAENQLEFRRILQVAQLRTPPRARSDDRPKGKGSAWQAHDPAATMVMQAAGNGRASAAPLSHGGPVVTQETNVDGRKPFRALVGGGSVRLCALGEHPAAGVVVVDAPPSDIDERGVREAQNGVAVLVAAQDHTRNRDLARLAGRLRTAGARAVGFVLTGGRGA